MINIKKIIVFLIFCLALISGYGQSFTQGVPLFRNYSPKEYDGADQTWAIIEDDRGVMYFGNVAGILEFDGGFWKIIDPVNAISFAKDQYGKIYVGGRNNIGFLEPDSKGNLKFTSLCNKIPLSDKDPGNVWHTYVQNNSVFFNSSNGKIYEYKNQKITIHEIDKGVSFMEIVDDKFFIITNKGLGILNNERMDTLKGSYLLANTQPRNIFAFGKDTFLVVTRTHGLYKIIKNEIKKWDIPINTLLIKYQVYLATQVNQNYVAFGTVVNGVLVMNKHGELVYEINKNAGMLSNDHCSIFTDKNGNIWSGLEYGICCIELSTPFTSYKESNGLTGAAIYSILPFKNQLYVGTGQGVYFKPSTEKKASIVKTSFRKVQKFEERKAWDLFPVKNYILSGGSNIGTFNIKDSIAEKITDIICPFRFKCSLDSNYLIGISEHKGFMVYNKRNNKWILYHYFRNLPLFNYFEVDKKGALWLTTAEKVFKINISQTFDSIIGISQYDSILGISAENLSMFKFKNKIYFGSSIGTLEFDTLKNKFVKSKYFEKSKNLFITEIKTDITGQEWYVATINNEITIGTISLSYNEIKYTSYIVPLKRINEFAYYSFCPIEENNIFIGSSNQLFQFNSFKKVNTNYNILLHSVECFSAKDSVIFGGCFSNSTGNIVSKQSNKNIPVLSYKNNSLRFKFAAAFFIEPTKTKYQFRLNGFDRNWSEWSEKKEKDYTNLPSGKYTFSVRAKNIYGTISNVAQYTFIITPPWYLTVWAFILYFILLVLLVILIVKLSIKKIKKENEKLEKIVLERTTEIRNQNQEILIKNSALIQQKEEILAQNEALNQQKEEISAQRDEIESQRDTLSLQKEKIEEIFTDIQSSILYAEKIQQAVLPNQTVLEQLFNKDYFVIYKPRNVVGGDFYWVTKRKNFILFAVADCTGHGVPGGFLSMLGITFLNEIATRPEINTTGEILDELRIHLIRALQQKGFDKEQKDGLDIVFCAYNTETKIIQYSGANNPLYIITKNQTMVAEENPKIVSSIPRYTPMPDHINSSTHQLIELKPDKMPVGIFYNMAHFKTHEVLLHPDDCLYLCTDGYIDQFGSIKRKKFLSSHLKQLLLKISQKPMNTQKEILESTLQSWMQNHEQTDDITLLGIKI